MLSPFIVERGGGMEWYCCKWPLPLLFCCTMTILLLSSSAQPREPVNARPSELSLFISLSTELGMLFLRAKIPFRFSLLRLMRVHLPRHTTASVGNHRETRKLSFRNDFTVTRLSNLRSRSLPEYNYSLPHPLPPSASVRPDVLPESSSQNLLGKERKLLLE